MTFPWYAFSTTLAATELVVRCFSQLRSVYLLVWTYHTIQYYIHMCVFDCIIHICTFYCVWLYKCDNNKTGTTGIFLIILYIIRIIIICTRTPQTNTFIFAWTTFVILCFFPFCNASRFYIQHTYIYVGAMCVWCVYNFLCYF